MFLTSLRQGERGVVDDALAGRRAFKKEAGRGRIGAPLIFINATIEAAGEFPLAHESLNLERPKAKVLADDACAGLNDAKILRHRRRPPLAEGVRSWRDAWTTVPRCGQEQTGSCFTFYASGRKNRRDTPKSSRGLLTFLNYEENTVEGSAYRGA
jgi:hypothetical protein